MNITLERFICGISTRPWGWYGLQHYTGDITELRYNWFHLVTFTFCGHECGEAKLSVSTWSKKYLFLSEWGSVLRAQTFGDQREEGFDFRHASAGSDGWRPGSVWSCEKHLHAQSGTPDRLTGAPEERRTVCGCWTRKVQKDRVRHIFLSFFLS